MTDLEKNWDDLPTGQPPIDDILRAGRRRASRRKRLVIRPLIVTGTVTAIAAAFVAGTQVNGTSTNPPAAQPDVRAAAFQADLEPAQSCAELLTSFKDRALAQVTAYGWNGGPYLEGYVGEFGAFSDQQRTDLPTATSSATGTNVQEPAVDEPDNVKTDGERIVRLRGSALHIYRSTATGLRELSSLNLPRIGSAEILLHGDTVIALGQDRTSSREEMSGGRRGSRVITVSLADPDKPAITSNVTYGAQILSARQHGTTVRFVLSSGLPDLDFVSPNGRKVTEARALATNREAVKASSLTDWLPTYDTGQGPLELLDCTDVAIPSEDLGLDTVAIVGIDTREPTGPHAIGLAGATTIAYESAHHLYLASRPASTFCGAFGDCRDESTGTTHVFDFQLDGIDARHIASGEVEGIIADRWSIDEADDVLRIAVGPSAETGNFNSIITMRRDGTQLVELGRVDRLGPREEIKAVRWFDDLAIVVTFRQVDPLYTVDLTDPAAPVLLGKLKIPGFSDYLHPLGEDRMLGIGYHGRNVQFALFDTSDLSEVRQIDVVKVERSTALAAEDPRAFTWLPQRNLALTVLQRGQEVNLASITVTNDTLQLTQKKVEYGQDAQQVRTVELKDNKIALVTGENVTLLP